MLELGDHRRRRVAGGTFPEAALHRGDEVDDPGTDGHAERKDGGGRRVLRDRCSGRAERDAEAGIEHVPASTVAISGEVDRTTIATPQQTAMSGAADAMSHPASSASAFAAIRRFAGMRLLQLDLQRAALSVATHQPDRDEGQQKGGCQLAGAERRRPDPDERREGFAYTGGRSVEAARFRVGPHGADERDADERADQDEHHPPGARRHKLAPLLHEEPHERRF